ncbi:MAG: clostripain-related cysteine peptidase [Methanocorpusculum sp.]|nr:clostripain-related cysteine peptidase [Methanocorpusculum sp.]
MNSKKILLLAVTAIICAAALSAPASAAGENYLVMYIVGSDLEFDPAAPDSPAATVNMIDLVSNWDTETGDILVFYGGSEKTGWNNGVSVTNLELLAKDLEDGSMGVDTRTNTETEYILGKIDGEISSADTLSTALAYGKEYAAENGLDSAKSTLIFWNHGNGYSGFGQNTVTNTVFSVDELTYGLAGSKFDIIAFDACVMASLEVTSALSPYADYFVGSEANVPGRGYNYAEFAHNLSANPSMSAENVAREIVTAFSHSSDAGKTLSVLKLNRTPAVVSALNEFGAALDSAIQQDDESLLAIASIYDTTMKYPKGIDLYQFTAMVYDNAYGDVKATAGSLIAALDAYVVCHYGDPQYTGGSNGVTVAGFTEEFKTAIPEVVTFGRNGWYAYLSQMTDRLEFSEPAASYAGRAVSVKNSVWSTTALGDFLYQKDGECVVMGQIPLNELYREGNGTWQQIPTGEYEEPEWTGGWLSFGSGSPGVLATMHYGYSVQAGGDVWYVYEMYGNLTREVNGVSVTRPSIITAVVDMNKMIVDDIYVTSVDEENPEYSVRSNAWGSMEILKGDVFSPLNDVYDEASNAISARASGERFTFTDNPVNDLSYKHMNDTYVYWTAEIYDYVDGDSVYLGEEAVPPAKHTKSPAPVFAVAAAVGFAVLLGKIRKSGRK